MTVSPDKPVASAESDVSLFEGMYTDETQPVSADWLAGTVLSADWTTGNVNALSRCQLTCCFSSLELK